MMVVREVSKMGEADLFEYKTNLCPRGKKCKLVHCWYYHEGEKMRDIDTSLNEEEQGMARHAIEEEKGVKCNAPYREKVNPFTGRVTIRELRKTHGVTHGDSAPSLAAMDIFDFDAENEDSDEKDQKIEDFA